MKKLFVILLAALLLVSFTSCNQDKIDDLEKKVAEKEAENETLKDEKDAIVKNYEDFMHAAYDATEFTAAYSDVMPNESKEDIGTIKLEELDSKTLSYSFKHPDLVELFASIEDGERIVIDSLTAKGNVTGKNVYDSEQTNTDWAIAFTNNEVAYEYHVVDENDATVSGKEELTVTLKISGSIAQKTDATAGTSSLSVNITANDKTYDVSYARKTTTREYIAAKVNGNDVELRLLNASITKGK